MFANVFFDTIVSEYDPNPLLSLGKRRRRNSAASCDSQTKDKILSVSTTTQYKS